MIEGIARVNVDRRTDQDLFEATVGPHYQPLVRRLTAVTRDAETGRDLAQEAYLRAYRAWDRFDGADARAWVYTIGLRLAMTELSRRRRWLSRRREQPDPSWVQPDHQDLHAALGELRPEHRAALLLNAVDGYTQAEIATILDVPPGTVATWIARAKSRMREALT